MIRPESSKLPAFVRDRLNDVEALCREQHVERLDVFGSVTRDDFDASQSDLDFVVEFEPDAPRLGLKGPYFMMRKGLRTIFDRDIDLVEYEAVRNPYFKRELDETRRRIYAK